MSRYVSSLALFCAVILGMVACSDDDSAEDSPTIPQVITTPSPTPAPADATQAQEVFRNFELSVSNGDIAAAWALYAASVPGTPSEHLADQGCEFAVFEVEFPKIQHMFAASNPLLMDGTFGDAPNSALVEFKMSGSDGQEFLVTLVRVQPWEGYRLKWMNNGQTIVLGSVASPPPSQEYPQGYCGVWTGPR